MTHPQKRLVEFSVAYLWDGVLCMFDLFMKVNRKKILLPSASPPRRESTPSKTHPKKDGNYINTG